MLREAWDDAGAVAICGQRLPLLLMLSPQRANSGGRHERQEVTAEPPPPPTPKLAAPVCFNPQFYSFFTTLRPESWLAYESDKDECQAASIGLALLSALFVMSMLLEQEAPRQAAGPPRKIASAPTDWKG